MNYVPKAIEVAAGWWADELNRVSRQDNGDRMQTTLMNSMRNPEVAKDKYSQSQVDAFRDILTGNIMVTAQWVRNERLTIHNDYAPDRILMATAEAVGIKVGMFDFPIKTVMFIRAESVRVGVGYGAPIETLYETIKGASERMALTVADAEAELAELEGDV